MLKVLYIFTYIVYCSGYSNKYAGYYDQIVLNLTHPITAFWVNQGVWPVHKYRPDNINLSDRTWASLTTPSFWIISSLWPSKNDGTHPRSCYQGAPPHISIDSLHKNKLSDVWAIYISKEQQEEHWIEAWREHGTCMVDLVQIDNHIHYFRTAFSLLNDNNIGALLKSSNIVSGNHYEIGELQNALQSHLGIDANLQCVEDEDGKQYLFGGSICFNKGLNREQCLQVAASNCVSSKPVHLPKLLRNN